MRVIYLDPCLYIPQGDTPEERATNRARIVARLWAHAEQLNRGEGGRYWRTVVGVPPWMAPTDPWMRP